MNFVYFAVYDLLSGTTNAFHVLAARNTTKLFANWPTYKSSTYLTFGSRGFPRHHTMPS